MKVQKYNFPKFSRKATFLPKTLNKEKRTVDIVFSTGAQVERGGFFSEPFIEELSMKKAHVRLGRLNNGAPFLRDHGRGNGSLFSTGPTIDDVIGVHENAMVDGKEGRATIRFSKREEVNRYLQDVEDGVLTNTSVGYRVHKFEKIDVKDKRNTTGMVIFRAIDWEPHENSLVAIGADPDAGTRSLNRADESQMEICEIISRSDELDTPEPVVDETPIDEPPIDENRNTQPTEPPKETPKNTQNLNDSQPAVDNQRDLSQDENKGDTPMTDEEKRALKAAATKAEKERQSAIRNAVKAANLEDSVADDLIESDKTADEARSHVIDLLAEKNKKPETNTQSQNAEGGEDNVLVHLRKGAETAMLHRFDPGHFKMEDHGRDFAYSSVLDIARMCLEAKGHKTRGMSPSDIADCVIGQGRMGRGLHSISDFPEILANVANKTLRRGYQEAPQTFAPFTRRVTAPDFKQISRTNLGDAPELEEILENGEIKSGTLSEAAEKYQVRPFGKIVGVTRQVIVNDDLDAFTRIPERMGRRARDLESDLVWGIIIANAALADTFLLFSSDHTNLGTPAVISDTSLGEARKNMRLQVGLDGAKITIEAKWLFVPPSLETVGEKQLTQITAQQASNVNPFAPGGRTPLQMGVEPRLEDSSATAWYMTGSLDQVDMIELATLSGINGPRVSSREGFKIQGMEIKIEHDLGAKAIDFRGLSKNAGV